MNIHDLTDKLSTMKTPNIDLSGHKYELRKGLMERHAIPPKPAFSGLIDRIQTGILSGLFSRQPVWKTTVLGAVVMGLVLSGVLIPAMTSNSVYAKAIDLIELGQDIRSELYASDNQSQSLDNYTFTVTVGDGTGTAVQETNGTITVRFPVMDELPAFARDRKVKLSLGKYDSDGNPVDGIPDDGTVTISTIQDGEIWIVEIIYTDIPLWD